MCAWCTGQTGATTSTTTTTTTTTAAAAAATATAVVVAAALVLSIVLEISVKFSNRLHFHCAIILHWPICHLTVIFGGGSMFSP
jgi:hypothetical protein